MLSNFPHEDDLLLDEEGRSKSILGSSRTQKQVGFDPIGGIHIVFVVSNYKTHKSIQISWFGEEADDLKNILSTYNKELQIMMLS